MVAVVSMLAIAMSGCSHHESPALAVATGPASTTAPTSTSTVSTTIATATTTASTTSPTTATTVALTSPVVVGSGPAITLTTITSADAGKTVNLSIGASVRLLLDDAGVQWGDAQVAPDGLLAGDPTPSPPPHGVLLIWTARQAGTATITATGTAWCAPDAACPMWARLFTVTVKIG